MITDCGYSTEPPDKQYRPATILKFFIVIAGISFILRIWYAGDLYQDDGLWFVAAEEILRGKALYREIFFDKPPALPLAYATLFKIFGPHILTIRLFTICYSVAVSAILYRFGSRFYDKRTGLIAAAMFAVFSTTYISGDIQSLNTDFLMVPFYSAGAYLLMLSVAQFIRGGNWQDRSFRLALAGGCMTGVAFQINPKGAFDLIFFALLLIGAYSWATGPLNTIKHTVAASKLFVVAVIGFALASLPCILYLSGTNSFSRYKLYVWDLSISYTNYYPARRAAEMFRRYGTDYFLINNLLLITLLVITASFLHRALLYERARRRTDAESIQPVRGSVYQAESCLTLGSDAALLIWFAVSFVGVATGGRFFAHYYFQALPSLCLIGARGLVVIVSTLKGRGKILRLTVTALLVAGLLYTLVRSHSETAALAFDFIRGRNSNVSREARIVSAIVRDVPDPADMVDRVGPEAVRQGGPRTRAADGPPDYLFVWGNWPEIYYRSGLLPASQYVGVQPLTGLPADLQYGKEEYRPLIDANLVAAARAELARELEQTQPKYIVDELGFRDDQLSIKRSTEMRDFMSNYERYGPDDSFPIYVRKTVGK